MTHRQILLAMSGLMLATFVASMGNTIVSTALPQIARDLDMGQAAYGWVMSATLLSLTVATPLWGELADRYHRKRLLQLSLILYTVGSMAAGLAWSVPVLIGCRIFQGIVVGGVVTLVQVVVADLIPPREQGRYAGYFTGVFGAGTISGPLLGGLITDLLGWRWCFFIGVPFSLVALLLLERRLSLPGRERSTVPIDWLGGVLLGSGIALVLVWVTGGAAVLAVGGVFLLISGIAVERRVAAPIFPVSLLGERTVRIGLIGGIAVGGALFASTVYLSQYMQLGRGYSPTASGLLTVPLVAGMVLVSWIGGRHITRTGRYRSQMLGAAIVMTSGVALMGLAGPDTNLIELGAFAALIGFGIGGLMTMLVVVVLNAVPQESSAAATALALFGRTLGGAIGVSVVGAVIAAAGDPLTDAIGRGFLALTAAGLVTVAAILLLHETPLRTAEVADPRAAAAE